VRQEEVRFAFLWDRLELVDIFPLQSYFGYGLPLVSAECHGILSLS
jgi:hypothetical protein